VKVSKLAFIISPMHATCPAYLILLDFITLTIISKAPHLQSSSTSHHFLPGRKKGNAAKIYSQNNCMP
jgi:hypothetical protein